MSFFSSNKNKASAAPTFIEVGQIVNTHGIKGDVKVQPWDVTPEQLCSFKTLYMGETPFRPTDKRVQGEMVLMHFPGWDDMTAAETLKTTVLRIKRGETTLPGGELFDAEIVGMKVYESFLRYYVGEVVEVLTYPAHKLYKVKGESKTYLIPAVEDVFIRQIDAEERCMYVQMMEGLEIDEG